MNCRKCNAPMVESKALQNMPSYGVPDFPGQTDLRGQTFSMTGPAVMLDLMKCPECGHSATPEKHP